MKKKLGIADVIEKYIDILIERDNLIKDIERLENNINYSSIEAGIAFRENRYERERGYDNSTQRSQKLKAEAEKKLKGIYKLQDSTADLLNEAVIRSDAVELEQASVILSSKKSDNDLEIIEMNKISNRSRIKAHVAFNEGNNEKELLYDELGKSSENIIKQLSARNHYYDIHINKLDLNVATKKETAAPEIKGRTI